LDVWEPEPDISRELLTYVRLGTPHIAGYSYDGKLKGTEMIYQALCRHLQCQPERSLQELVPPLENNQLAVPDGDAWTVIKCLVKQVYDIAADDLALRNLGEQCGSDDALFAQGFDALRKHYPIRREMLNYQLAFTTSATDSELMARLTALGFSLN
jgi:erythronate-4-phosphate dehydrogenase